MNPKITEKKFFCKNIFVECRQVSKLFSKIIFGYQKSFYINWQPNLTSYLFDLLQIIQKCIKNKVF